MKNKKRKYIYQAKVLRVVDGDTIEVFIDFGFGMYYKDKLRLLDFDAAETHRPSCVAEKIAGEKAKELLKSKVEGKDVTLKTYKRTKGKYGRILARIFIDDIDIIQEMINAGMEKEEKWK